MSATERSFETLRAEALAAGFDEAVVREWPPGTTLAAHAHPFDAQAVVTKGEMWLTVGEHTRHLYPDDTFALACGQSHEERYGADDAIYRVARRSGE